jgi:hypothetical protein
MVLHGNYVAQVTFDNYLASSTAASRERTDVYKLIRTTLVIMVLTYI